jgi:hypothetical protein
MRMIQTPHRGCCTVPGARVLILVVAPPSASKWLKHERPSMACRAVDSYVELASLVVRSVRHKSPPGWGMGSPGRGIPPNSRLAAIAAMMPIRRQRASGRTGCPGWELKGDQLGLKVKLNECCAESPSSTCRFVPEPPLINAL